MKRKTKLNLHMFGAILLFIVIIIGSTFYFADQRQKCVDSGGIYVRGLYLMECVHVPEGN